MRIEKGEQGDSNAGGVPDSLNLAAYPERLRRSRNTFMDPTGGLRFAQTAGYRAGTPPAFDQ